MSTPTPEETIPVRCGAQHPRFPSTRCEITGPHHTGPHIGIISAGRSERREWIKWEEKPKEQDDHPNP